MNRRPSVVKMLFITAAVVERAFGTEKNTVCTKSGEFFMKCLLEDVHATTTIVFA